MAIDRQRIVVDAQSFYELILLPSFGDLIDDGMTRSGYFGEFTVMDDVADSRKIVDIAPISNILKRRDASCKVDFDPVGRAKVRRLSVTDLYGATAWCSNEFYQGCLKDWKANNSQVFLPKILDFFKKAIRRDLIANMYFGDITRAEASDTPWNTNKFDGIYTEMIEEAAAGVIKPAQRFSIAAGSMSPAAAIAALRQLWDSQDELLRLMPTAEKAFYIDQDWATAYEDYLTTIGTTTSDLNTYVQNGVTVRAYRGIPIFVNPFFTPILTQITGDVEPHFGYLTLRGNFIFGTDQSYGIGPNDDQALAVWYSWDEMTWKWVNVLKAGVRIALPEHMAVAFPA